METKNCPYCGGEIMATAKKCKHCGEWLVDRQQSPQHTSKSETQPQEDVEIKHSNTKKIILFVVGGIILAFVIWLIIIKNQKSDWEKAMEQYNSQTPYIEEVLEAEETVPYYDEGTVCPYDGVPDDEYDGGVESTYPYDPNSNANAWE